MKSKRISAICLIAFFIAVFPPTKLNGQSSGILPQGLDQYVENVLTTFEVPGMALAVVKNGEVILAKGYGVRKMGDEARVNAHTLFPIASNSKAFTGVALTLLVEEGKIEWDKPVVQYLPWFKLSDPLATAELSVRDLLVHRSGIAPYAGDLLQFPPTTYTRSELVERLRYLPLATSFRSTYAYDNVLYLVAGVLVEEISGLTWEDFVKQRIFTYVGMNESISKFSEFRNQQNVAISHAPVGGKVKPLESFFEQGLGDVSNPAGGIVSNAADMAKWLVAQLDSGRTASGHQLFSKASATNLWQGVTPMPIPRSPAWLAPAQQDFASYALGFRVYTYRNQKAVTHGGKLDGFVSYVIFFPDHNLGIAVLTNQESSNAYHAVINHIVDHVFGVPPFDWVAGYRKQEDLKFGRIADIEKQAEAKRNASIGPSLPLERYAGRYKDAWYGDINITRENDELIMRFAHSPLLVGKLEHWQYDTFVVRWHNKDLRADAYVTFSLDHDGSIHRVRMKAVSPITDVSYDFHDLDIYPANSLK